MGELPENKNKMVFLQAKMAKIRRLSQKLHKEAQKLALAVVITQYLIAGGWYFIEKQGIASYFGPKTIVIEVAKPAEAKVKAPETLKIEAQEDKTERIEELADLIYQLESSKGKNNYSKCEAIGKVNGIGYGIYNGKWQCFGSHEEEMQVLENWIKDKQAQGMTESEMLCLYSGGNYQNCNN